MLLITPVDMKRSKVTEEMIQLLEHRDKLGWELYGRALEDSRCLGVCVGDAG